MKFVAIVAESPNAALTQVHEQLGPDAVIVSVRKICPTGFSWLWPQSRKIEVTACVPQTSSEPKREHPPRKESVPLVSPGKLGIQRQVIKPSDGQWRSIGWLEANGLLPAFTKQLEEKVQILYGGKPLPTMPQEWTAITDLIICHWLPARQMTSRTGRPHVFIGPAGSGKTTVLCKWMTSAVLINESRVRLWRLDGESANSSGLLTLHCELMGVPIERVWNEPDEAADLQ